MDIEEVAGHHIEVEKLDDIVHVLHCECGWRIASHVEEVEGSKQLHWAAKIVERETLDEMEDDVRDAIASLRNDPDEQWLAAIRDEDGHRDQS